jgi:hypothetical protein
MLKINIIFGALLFLLMTVSEAKDVSIQQTGYNNALRKMERAEADYKSDAEDVASTEKLIERKNKQLAEEQKKAELSKANYMAAKDQLEQAQSALDKAWKD